MVRASESDMMMSMRALSLLGLVALAACGGAAQLPAVAPPPAPMIDPHGDNKMPADFRVEIVSGGAVAWDEGGEPVELAILIAVRPGAASAKHLKTIAALSRRLCDDAFRERLLAAPDDASLASLLAEAAGAHHPGSPETKTA